MKLVFLFVALGYAVAILHSVVSRRPPRGATGAPLIYLLLLSGLLIPVASFPLILQGGWMGLGFALAFFVIVGGLVWLSLRAFKAQRGSGAPSVPARFYTGLACLALALGGYLLAISVAPQTWTRVREPVELAVAILTGGAVVLLVRVSVSKQGSQERLAFRPGALYVIFGFLSLAGGALFRLASEQASSGSSGFALAFLALVIAGLGFAAVGRGRLPERRDAEMRAADPAHPH